MINSAKCIDRMDDERLILVDRPSPAETESLYARDGCLRRPEFKLAF
jgi:hypothetical protein